MMPAAGGIVVCGGESRRMGQPKAWLPFGHERLLPRVVRLVGEVVRPVIVVAAAGQALPPLPREVEVVCDNRPGRGPLEGIAAGLRRLQELGSEAAYVSSTDVPFLSPHFIRKLLALLGDSWVAVPFVDGRHHPLAAAYRAACLPVIERLLGENRLRPVFLFDEVATRVIQAHELSDVDPNFQSLRNVNSPDEYQLALHDLAEPRD